MPKNKKSVLFVFSIIAELIVFLFITKDSVLTVHDDIITYMQVLRGDLWNIALSDAKHGRICHIPLTYLLYIPYFARSPIVVRLFSCLSFAFDLSAVFLLFKKLINKDFAYLSVIASISFACISNQHNLFAAYILGHQIPVGMAIYSFYFMIRYYEENKTKFLIFSSLFFVLSCCLYEASCAYIIMLLMICVSHTVKDKKINIKALLKDLRFHIIGLSVFFLIYFGWRLIFPSDYDGSKLWFGNIPLSLLAILKYSFGMFPCLPAGALIIKKYISVSEIISVISPAVLIIPLISAAAFYRLFPKADITSKKLKTIIFCISGIILPNTIISFTEKYASWAKTGSYSYVTSFYSYFFLIPLLFIILKMIFSKPLKKPALIILSSLVFIVSLTAGISNTAWNRIFEKKLLKYEAFENAVENVYFDSLPDDSVVFIPDFYGIHGDMDTTESFAQIYSSAKFDFENDPSLLDFSRPVFCLRYDPETSSVLIGQIDSSFCSDSVFVIGKYDKPIEKHFDMMAAFECSITQ